MSIDDIEKAMSVIDSNNNGVIDYTEFIDHSDNLNY